MDPYQPRPVRFHGVHRQRGWRLKLYSIRCDARPLDWSGFDPGLDLAHASLPEPVFGPSRPGVGFVIAHQGRNADYVVLGWWDRENELPVRVFVREAGRAWSPARGQESFCVWDLQVMWFEREAYVSTLMAADADDPMAAYLDRELNVEAP